MMENDERTLISLLYKSPCFQWTKPTPGGQTWEMSKKKDKRITPSMEEETQEEAGGDMVVSAASLIRPAAAGAYYCQDFDWELLRDEIENGARLQGLECATEGGNPVALENTTKVSWEKFHERHVKGLFFKERRYLVKEFPELLAADTNLKVLEVGCGTGSSVLPILRANSSALVYGCDCSILALKKALELANSFVPHPEKCRFVPFHCDICSESLPSWLFCSFCRESFASRSEVPGHHREMSAELNFQHSEVSESCKEVCPCTISLGDCILNNVITERESSSCDFSKESSEEASSERFASLADKEIFTPCCVGGVNIVMMVFTLSSIPPARMRHVIKECYSVLEPGGLLLLRDYGLYDMTMLRFPAAQRVGERLYRRNDGTLSYFFTPDVLRDLFVSEHFREVEIQLCCVHLMNRQKSLPMKRVWIHAKFFKPAV